MYTSTGTGFADVAATVHEGFTETPKRLPSWLFYDETGDRIFQMIMRMPEYYLTSCEYEILQMNKERLLKQIGYPDEFQLVELGAGDGTKTEILLKHFSERNVPFVYTPVDVSANVLSQLTDHVSEILPDLTVDPIRATYSEALHLIRRSDMRKVILFLGANIGNFTIEEATEFMSSIAETMDSADQLLVGFDLKKDPRLIQAAYDDPYGITRDFNINLLVRLNRELGANFQLDQFRHYPYYDPETGMTKSYLISQKDQDVYFEVLDRYVHFQRWEPVHTEVSQKYDVAMIEALAEAAGLTVKERYFDCRHYFCDVLLVK